MGTEKQVFNNLNLKVEDGDFITIIGSNGAGKSTLLNVLNGQITPDSGEIILNGKIFQMWKSIKDLNGFHKFIKILLKGLHLQ